MYLCDGTHAALNYIAIQIIISN